MARPTIVDVAARAGVSKSLVSLVMRGAPNVRDEKRELVLEAARALGYRPNHNARTLAGKRSQLVGVLLADLHNPFFAELIDGVEAVAAESDHRVLMTAGLREPARERSAIGSLLELRVDALLLADPQLPIGDLEPLVSGVPTVTLARASRSKSISSIVNDDRAGAHLAVDHLVALGHRRIAHVDAGRRGGAGRRRTGYIAAMATHGLEAETHIAAGDYTEEGGARGAMALLADPRRRPTAIFAANDICAIGVLDALEAAGLRVPGDVSLVGYDNTHLAALGHISLTTIDQPRREMGAMALEMAYSSADGASARHIELAPQLVVRTTTTPPTH